MTKSFEAYREEIMSYYQAGDYLDARRLTEEAAALYPDRAWSTTNWLMCFAAIDGDRDLAMKLFREAVDQGVWWSEDMLRDDPDLKSLHDHPDFDHLVSICQDRFLAAREGGRPQMVIQKPTTTSTREYPLLLFFHGRNSNAREYAYHFEALRAMGWFVAMPQSSQVTGVDMYAWDDIDLALEEIKKHWLDLRREFPIDPKRTVLGGFSQGGGLAARLALQPNAPSEKFLAIAPWAPDLDWLPQRPEDVPEDARGFLVLGGRDDTLVFGQDLKAALTELKVPVLVDFDPERGHDFPVNSAEVLARALDSLAPRVRDDEASEPHTPPNAP